MKWSIFVCLLMCLARVCEGGALRCLPGVPECTEENIEIADTKVSTSPPSYGGASTECLAGTEWESHCHNCRCLGNGKAQCTKRDSCDGTYEEPYLCKSNTTFLRDCNKCLCLDSGMALCSMENCSDKPQGPSIEDIDKTDPTTNSEQTDTVVPRIRELKNNSIKTHDMVKRSTICKPYEEFFSGCNLCTCTLDGYSYSCTQKECFEGEKDKDVEVFMESEGADHIERHSVCRAGNTFHVSCNACHCNAFGTDYTCTNKPCPLPADVEVFDELKTAFNDTKAVVCVANRMFVKDCNTCWCNEDGTSYFCTRRVCVPLLPDEESDLGGIPAENLRVTKKQCRPDEIFEMDCNMCRCNPDGKSYSCTRKACLEPFENKNKKNATLSRKVRGLSSETTKACQPGQEFRMDCNKCLCDNEGQDFSCTRMDCNAQNNNLQTITRRKRDATEEVSTECVAGSVFQRGCNVCRCTKEGNFAICTLKNCAQNEVEHVTESENGFRCNAGEQFKRDCNDCTCSADGKSVFCTLRLCDQDLATDI